MDYKDYQNCFSSSCMLCNECCKGGNVLYLGYANIFEKSTGLKYKPIINKTSYEIYTEILKVYNNSLSKRINE